MRSRNYKAGAGRPSTGSGWVAGSHTGHNVSDSRFGGANIPQACLELAVKMEEAARAGGMDKLPPSVKGFQARLLKGKLLSPRALGAAQAFLQRCGLEPVPNVPAKRWDAKAVYWRNRRETAAKEVAGADRIISAPMPTRPDRL